jgi:uncharacterized protein (TIGR03437 family)
MIRRMRILACIALLTLFTPVLSAQTVYSAVAQYSLNSNPNGPWSYLDSTQTLSPYVGGTGIVGLFGWVSPVSTGGAKEGIWKNITASTLNPPAYPNLLLPPDHLFLGSFVSKLTVRFTAPSAGAFTVTGDFLGVDTGQLSHPVSVLVNGSAMFSGTLSNYQQSLPFAFTATLKPGDLVDFVSTGLGPTDYSSGLAATLTLNAPSTTISPTAIVSASAFGGFAAAAPGSWIEIYGMNLAGDTRSWAGTDFNGNTAPTSLDGTSIMIGGQLAYIDYISPAQVNALVPSNVATGVQQVIVKTANGTGTTFPLTINALEPGILAPSSFKIGSTQYAAGILSDGTYAIPAGAIIGVQSRPAKPGETLILYGVGFGPVTPSSSAGQLVQQANSLTSSFQISIGGIPATVLYDGLAPGYTGLYQFNITVPNAPAGATVPVTFSLAGNPGTETLNIAVSN